MVRRVGLEGPVFLPGFPAARRAERVSLFRMPSNAPPVGQANARRVAMKGFVQDIEGLAVKNADFRRVLYTAKNCQLVVMALTPGKEIAADVQRIDQIL